MITIDPKGSHEETKCAANIKNLNERTRYLTRRYSLFSYACAYWYEHIHTLEEAKHEWKSIHGLLDRMQAVSMLWIAASSPSVLKSALNNRGGFFEVDIAHLALEFDIPWLTHMALFGQLRCETFTTNQTVRMARTAPNSYRTLCDVMKRITTPILRSQNTVPIIELSTRQQFESLLLAVQTGHSEIVQALLDTNMSWDIHSNQKAILLDEAIKYDCYDILSMLLHQRLHPATAHRRGYPAIHVAVSMHHLSAVEFLVKNGADINTRNNIGSTPLMQAVFEGSFEITDFLLSAGADANVHNQQGYTALLYAVSAGHVDTVRMLLQRGADPHLSDYWGKNALHYAAENGHAVIIRILLEADCNPNSLNRSSVTSLHMAAVRQNPIVVQALVSGGADPLLLDDYGRTSLDWASAYEPCFKAMGTWTAHYTATPSRVSREILRKCLSTWLREHCDSSENKPLSSTVLYPVGRLLLLLDDLPAACIALETELQMVSGELVQSAFCNACRIKHGIRGPRYVCKSCAITDFCKSCFLALQSTLQSDVHQVDDANQGSEHSLFWASDNLNAERSRLVVTKNGQVPSKDYTWFERCKTHKFIEVPRTEWRTFKPGCIDEHGTSITTWASNLYERYEEMKSAPS